MRRPDSALLLVALVAAALPAQRSELPALADSLFAGVDPRGPGCVVGAAQGGRVVLERAYGMANLETGTPLTPTTILEAGSVSKQFTAAAVVLLALDGKLSLDDDVRRHVPELPDYGTRVTLRHLLHHTSGLRDWGSVLAFGERPRGTFPYTNAHVLEVVARQRALNYAPGAHYSYTNSGYNLLAIVVARVAGMPFAEFTRQRLFVPVGMTRTSWRDDYARTVPGRAQAYAGPGPQARLEMPFEHAHGNGGLLTTVGDLLRWTAMLDTPDPAVGGRALVDSLHVRGVLASGRRIAYALGLVEGTRDGVREVSHSGATAGYRAWLARYPAHGVAVAVLCNGGGFAPTPPANAIADALLPPRRAAATPAVPLDSVTVAPHLGDYRHPRTHAVTTLRWDAGRARFGANAILRAADGGWTLGGGTLLRGPGSDLRVVSSEADTIHYVRVARWAPTADELRRLAGRYASDEADAQIAVEVDGDRAFLRRGPVTRLVLRPTYRDAFEFPGGVLRIERDAGGTAVAVRLANERAWDVRFPRLP